MQKIKINMAWTSGDMFKVGDRIINRVRSDDKLPNGRGRGNYTTNE